MTLGGAGPLDEGCAAEGAIEYICGLQKPEDILALEGTRWLVASGFTPGGGLKLIDGKKRTVRPWFTDTTPVRWNRAAWPNCPGALDPVIANTRGLSLRRTARNRWRLLAVNHGGRESIEAFEITLRAGKPSLVWTGCQPMPAGQVGNSVASFADGTILTTVLTRPGTSIADFVERRVTGGVWSWHPRESAFRLLPGTELPGNNGIETDPDGRRFYVVAFGWHSVVVFDRRDTSIPLARIEAPDFMPDNIHWSGGRLLLAGMRRDEPACGGLRKVVNGVADPMLCHRGWKVGKLDRARQRVTTIAEGEPLQAFNGASAAAISRGILWLGSFQSDRLAFRETADTR